MRALFVLDMSSSNQCEIFALTPGGTVAAQAAYFFDSPLNAPSR
jgi:hypothetical protein